MLRKARPRTSLTFSRHLPGGLKRPADDIIEYRLLAGGRSGEVGSGRGSLQKENPDFLDPIKNFCPSARFKKNHCRCIVEGHLSTNLTWILDLEILMNIFTSIE